MALVALATIVFAVVIMGFSLLGALIVTGFASGVNYFLDRQFFKELDRG